MRPKIIAMIPARMGSKRIPKKNLRFLAGKPLIFYVLDTITCLDIFDDIYINSESEALKEIAHLKGVKFYERPTELASDSSTNDEFALDFMQNVPGDILIQILPTSPFLTANEIKNFTEMMLNHKLDTLISVEHKQIACVYKNQSINFDPLKPNPPSQSMEPIKAYATALMGWTYASFEENIRRHGSAYHGGNSRKEFFELRGLSTIDIDREDDFLLAEAIMRAQTVSNNISLPHYWPD